MGFSFAVVYCLPISRQLQKHTTRVEGERPSPRRLERKARIPRLMFMPMTNLWWV